MKKYLAILLFLMLHGLQAQVEFKAVPSRTKIGVNEKVSVAFTVNGYGDNFVPPSFEGFRASKPAIGQKSGWDKGVLVTTNTHTIILTPTQMGSFAIGQGSIEVDGKTYTSAPFTISVGKAVKNPDTQKMRADDAFAPDKEQQLKEQEQQLEKLVVMAVADKTTINLGQTVTLELITKNSENKLKQAPGLEDFAVINGPQDRIENSWYGNIRYFRHRRVYTLKPRHTGTLTIGAAEMEVDGKIYYTNPITITVN
jgi:BatD DUF11 like domain